MNEGFPEFVRLKLTFSKFLYLDCLCGKEVVRSKSHARLTPIWLLTLSGVFPLVFGIFFVPIQWLHADDEK